MEKKRIKGVNTLYRSAAHDRKETGQFGAAVDQVRVLDEAGYPDADVRYVQVKTK